MIILLYHLSSTETNRKKKIIIKKKIGFRQISWSENVLHTPANQSTTLPGCNTSATPGLRFLLLQQIYLSFFRHIYFCSFVNCIIVCTIIFCKLLYCPSCRPSVIRPVLLFWRSYVPRIKIDWSNFSRLQPGAARQCFVWRLLAWSAVQLQGCLSQPEHSVNGSAGMQHLLLYELIIKEQRSVQDG